MGFWSVFLLLPINFFCQCAKYTRTIFPHNMLQSVQRTMESRHVSRSELAKIQQELTQMSDYMRKQQLEYQEALSSLQRKVGRADEMEQENLKIHQLNVNLAAELEDYRQQTKTLLADLRQKEEEIASLRQRRSQFSSSDVSSSDRRITYMHEHSYNVHVHAHAHCISIQA